MFTDHFSYVHWHGRPFEGSLTSSLEEVCSEGVLVGGFPGARAGAGTMEGPVPRAAHTPRSRGDGTPPGRRDTIFGHKLAYS